ncbi:MAG: magnesium transporter [Asticcacaulis sp.]
MVKSRLPWLLINLATAFASVTVINVFQGQILKMVVLASLMPVVASIGGNFGTQALTVSVRALSSRELTAANAARTLWREIFSAWVTGACVGLGLAAVTMIFWHDVKLAIVIAAAIMINFTMAALAGTLIPMGASKLGMDPAAPLRSSSHW